MSDRQRCDVCPVRSSGICAALNDNQLNLAGIGRKRFVEAGQLIFREGDEAAYYAVIISGDVKLTKTLPSGRQSVTGLMFASDFLGQIFNRHHTFSAEAATDAALCILPRDAFLRLMDEFPALERELFKAASGELNSYRDWTMLLRQSQACQRVAGFLHLLAKRAPRLCGQGAGETGGVHFALPLARGEIADFLGITKETVSRQMTLMKSRGIISLVSPREVAVPDVEVLAAFANRGTGEAPGRDQSGSDFDVPEYQRAC